jgi:hypothetical protein
MVAMPVARKLKVARLHDFLEGRCSKVKTPVMVSQKHLGCKAISLVEEARL